MNYQDINASTIDRWIEDGWEWGKPITHEVYQQALQGQWDVLLTPTKPVPHNWFGIIGGKKLLGLASGGGQQMPIFAALGADCTVLDYSPRQIESEHRVAEREGYQINILQADMTQPLPFQDDSFDLIFHPVSNCYVREVEPVWRECSRILKPGGRLLAGFDLEINYVVNPQDETRITGYLPFDPLKNPDQMKELQDADCGVQFSHTLEEQLGGLLRSGFEICDLYQDTTGEGEMHKRRIPAFLAVLAKKK